MNPSKRSLSFPSQLGFLAAIALASVAASLVAADATPPGAPQVATPIVSSDEATQKNLADLDRLLDSSDLKFEETLRKNVDQLEAAEFRSSNPEIDVVLKERPWIAPTLKAERHFLIHRYVAHRARGALLRPDVIALDEFLTAHPDIRQALDSEPARIFASDFLMANPSLGEFFDQHPSLSTILLEKQGAPAVPTDT